MRKNLNKIVAFAIGVSVISGSIVPAMAETKVTYIDLDAIAAAQESQKNAKPVLTIDDAIEGAKSCSNTIAILNENIKLTRSINSLTNKKNDVLNEQDDSSKGVTDNQKDYEEDKGKLTVAQLEQKRDFQIDKLAQNVTDSYNSLILSEANIAKLKRDIELQKNEIEQYNLKKSLGLVTDINIDQVNISLQKNLNDLSEKENTIKDDKYKFKVLTGKDVNKYTLEDIIQYNKFELEDSLDDYLDSQIEEYLTYTEQINQLNKDYWEDDDNKVSNNDIPKKPTKDEIEQEAPKLDLSGAEDVEKKIEKIENYLNNTQNQVDKVTAYTGMIAKRMNYLQNKTSVTTRELELKESKDQYKIALRTIYTSLVNLENSIDLINSNIELKNKQVRLDKVNYDLGLMTKLKYDQSVNECETLNIQLKTAVNSYNTLKAKLEKPWIALS